MANEKERQAVLKVYNSRTWLSKINKMSDAQVVAIYLRLKGQNKI